jgi:hypothetical protein
METYHGHVRTPADAIVLFEACRLGLLPRVQRRLSEKERQQIKSGSVFVWDEREAGMRRWTDGKSWSASRVSGSFLTYREMEGKRGGSNAFAPPVTTNSSQRAGRSPNPDGSDSDGMDPEGPDGYRYKPDGLMKQSFSITTATHQKLHLISYYARSHPASSNLVQPTQDASLKHIRPVKGMYPESTVHEQQNVPVRTSMISSMPHHTPLQHSPVMGYNRQGATHPASYQQLPANSYGWPPSPVGTPPTNMTGVPVQQYVTPVTLSGSAIPGASGSYGVPPPIAQFAPTPVAQDGSESPRMYERPLLPTPSSLGSSSHRGSVGMLLAPRSPNNAHAQIQRSTPPLGLPLPYPTQPHDDRLSPAATSISTSTPPEGEVPQFDISPLRSGSTGGDSDAARSLEVQDIPSEKFGFREDVRALRVLDRVFSA